MPQSPAYWPKAFSTGPCAFSEESRALASKPKDPRKERECHWGVQKKIKGELRRKPGTLSHPVGVTGRDLSWGAGDLDLIPTVLPSCIELQGSSKFQASPCSPASVLYHVQRQTDSSHLQGLGDQLEKVLRIPRNPAGHAHSHPQLHLFWGSQREHWPRPDPPPWLAPSEGGPNCAPSHCSLRKGPQALHSDQPGLPLPPSLAQAMVWTPCQPSMTPGRALSVASSKLKPRVSLLHFLSIPSSNPLVLWKQH